MPSPIYTVIFTIISTIFTSTDKVRDGLYICNTYCFTYAEKKISLNHYLCNNIYTTSCYSFGWNTTNFTIKNVSCNDLYQLSFNGKPYRYTNPPYIEKYCIEKNINCNIECNPYKLNCTIDNTSS